MKRTFLAALAALAVLALLLAVGRASAKAEVDEILVIVHATNDVSAMNRSQLAALFKVKSTQFPGGGRATAVNLPPESPVRQEFDLAVLGLRPEEVERFWIDSKVRSGAGAPRKLPGPASVVRMVSTDTTGIGYVPSLEGAQGVRIVARIRGGRVLAP